MTSLDPVLTEGIGSDLYDAIERGDVAKYNFFRIIELLPEAPVSPEPPAPAVSQVTAEVVYDPQKSRFHRGYQRTFLRFARHFEQVAATHPSATPKVREIARALSTWAFHVNEEMLEILVPMSDARSAKVDRLDDPAEPLFDTTVETVTVPQWDRATGIKTSGIELRVRRLVINLRRYLHDDGSGYKRRVDTFLQQAKASYDLLLGEKGLTAAHLYTDPNLHVVRNFYEMSLFPKVVVSVFLSEQEIGLLKEKDPGGVILREWPTRHEGRRLVAFEMDLSKMNADSAYREQLIRLLTPTSKVLDAMVEHKTTLPVDLDNAYHAVTHILGMAVREYWDQEEGIDRYGSKTDGSQSLVGAVTDANFEAEVLRSTVPVYVDVWAEWCGPCLVLSPELEKFAARHQGRIRVVKLHADDNPRTAEALGNHITGLPTGLLFSNGQVVGTIIGYDGAKAFHRDADALVERVLQ